MAISNTMPSIDLSKLKVISHVTLPQLKLEAGRPVYVTLISEIYTAEATAPSRNRTDSDGNPAAVMAPPQLVQVLDISDLYPKQMIVNDIVGKELTKKYDGNSYVGKSFVIALANIQGKRYKGAEVTEFDPESIYTDQAGIDDYRRALGIAMPKKKAAPTVDDKIAANAALGKLAEDKPQPPAKTPDAPAGPAKGK